MAEIKTGGPAFPTRDMVQRDENGNLYGYPISSAGMTLRDYFAAQALAGDLSAQSMDIGYYDQDASDEVLLAQAIFFYRFADAMIAAREGGAK
ncbi:hypothetical protein QBD01_003717 [Ochrobactrum sp. 19YEA23]|uniref:hypothetical protein n=1 Tax=Ochrobactrum sp. 19YEA23 TaxID=3039854 RepID=UPI00247B1D40|nr:hypothetical protein [Ochrobactrum sp. 19YEA23]